MATSNHLARVCFVEMMGEPGSYDDSVYDHLEDGDNEGVWFQKNYGSVPGIEIFTTNVCMGEPLPGSDQVDGLILAGSYNSVHDNTQWQHVVRQWIPGMREQRIPILGICGSHQLIAHQLGSRVVRYNDGPFAGTFPVRLTEAGVKSPIMQSIQNDDCFHYANNEHVTEIPTGSTLLASSSKVPVAALDFGNHCYSTQFHPEATVETLGTIWKHTSPELCENYHSGEMGDVLVRNFLNLVVSQCRLT
jgi:GMP synthase (glutamine-hydrolysing)